MELLHSSWPRGVYYALITFLTIVIYLMIFAKPLPVLRQTMAVVALALGTYVLWWFHNLGMPVLKVLIATVIMILVVRIRILMTRWMEYRRSMRQKESGR